MYATPGVGKGPIKRTSTPMDSTPAAIAFSSMYPDKRVSLPITIRCRPRPRDTGTRFLKTYAAARPSFRAVSAVTGSTLATPRTPSVPKSFRLMLVGSGFTEDFYTRQGTAVNRRYSADFSR